MRKRKFELKRAAAAFLAVVTMALTAAAVPSAAGAGVRHGASAEHRSLHGGI